MRLEHLEDVAVGRSDRGRRRVRAHQARGGGRHQEDAVGIGLAERRREVAVAHREVRGERVVEGKVVMPLSPSR